MASSERRFFTGMALIVLVTVFVGFSRSFFLAPLFPDWPAPTESIIYVHGAAAAAWILLFVVQTGLIAGGRPALHRSLGTFGVGLAALVVVLGVAASLVGAQRPTGFVDMPIPPLQFLAVPLFDITLFAIFVGLAVALRRDAQSHKRWMLLATINFLSAAIARWPVLAAYGPPAFFGVADLFIVALVVWDYRSRGRLHPATLWGGLAIIVSQPLRMMISGTDGWLAFARWATGVAG
jgi:hypothetical protein